MRIILFCPPAIVINGGIKQIFGLADTLCDQGFDAAVFEEQGRRPDWFASHAPVVGQGVFQPRADEVLVLPEDQPQILAIFKDWPQRKVVYSQNQFFGAMSLENVASFADYDIHDALCCSLTTLDHMKWRHPSVRAHLVINGINRAIFKPAPKEKIIAYMPRKRPVEAAFIKDIFRYTFPECEGWQWMPINGLNEQGTADIMARASVFLALSRLESLGLSPLEAMSCGAIVAGFTGIGGREYAKAENGFWVDEDDFPACAKALRQAIALAEQPADSPARQAYAKACEAALAPYTLQAFADGAAKAFRQITAP